MNNCRKSIDNETDYGFHTCGKPADATGLCGRHRAMYARREARFALTARADCRYCYSCHRVSTHETQTATYPTGVTVMTECASCGTVSELGR